MTLIVILICLGVQRFLKFGSYSHQLKWVDPYFNWMSTKFEQVTKGHGFIATAILVLPVLIFVAIIFALVFNLLGTMGHAVLSIVFVWYCMDGRDARKEPYENLTLQDFFITSYRNLFGVLFWYGLFGPVGLALYFVVSKLQAVVMHKPVDEEASDVSLQHCLNKTMGILDWVPVRLLGLSYALVGHFGLVFKAWMHKLFHGVTNTQELVAEWGMVAMQNGAKTTEVQLTEGITMVDRCLIVWLIVIFLVTFGMLLS